MRGHNVMDEIKLLENQGIDLSKTHNSLQEVFALPVGLTEVAKLDGLSLYSSAKLQEKYLAALSMSGRTKDLVDKFEILVKNKDIIPCFLGKGFGHFIFWKIFAPLGDRSIMGFYDPGTTNKIYLLIDNNSNIFGFTSNETLALLTIHEMCHKFAHDSPSQFLSRYRPELTKFYKYYWCEVFQVKEDKLSDSAVFELVTSLFKKCESGNHDLPVLYDNFKTFVNQLAEILSKLSTLNETEFTEVKDKYILCIKVFMKNLNDFINNISKFRQILAPLYTAYKYGLDAKNLQTLAVQELLYPSEVLAVYSESSKKVGASIASGLV
jgi:hypothetical protein